MPQLCGESRNLFFVRDVRAAEQDPIEADCAVLDGILQIYSVSTAGERRIKHEDRERTVFQCGELGKNRRNVRNGSGAGRDNAATNEEDKANDDRNDDDDNEWRLQDLTRYRWHFAIYFLPHRGSLV